MIADHYSEGLAAVVEGFFFLGAGTHMDLWRGGLLSFLLL